VSGDPFLPLSREQAAALVRALDGAIEPEADAGGGSEKLPRIPEKVVTELVRTLRAEGTGDNARNARRRARRVGAIGGLAGMLGQLPAEALQLVEEVRAAVDIAAQRAPGRGDAQIAADVLVVWGLIDDLARAEAMTAGASDGSLLDMLYRDSASQVNDAIPERWTPVATLKFLWKMRELRSVKDLMPGGIVRNIPVIGAVPTALSAGREMKRFQKDLERHYDALPT